MGEALTPSWASETVELVAAGAEPRRELRFALNVGSTAEQDASTRLEQSSAGAAQFFETTTHSRLTVDAVGDDGIAELTTTVLAASLVDAGGFDEATRAGLETGIGMTVGVEGRIELAPRGHQRVVDVIGDAPGVADGLAAGSASAIVFPVEPVGVGAEWVMRSGPDIGSGRSSLESTVRLIEVDGDIARLEVEQDLETQSALESSSTSGTGLLVVDLGSPLPVEASSTADGVITLAGLNGGAEVEQTTTISSTRR